MLSALILLIILSILAVIGFVQLTRAVIVARPRAQVRDFFEAPDGDSWLEGEANRLRRQADRLRRSKSVDAPMQLLIGRIVDDLMKVVDEERDRRRQAKRLLELQQHYDDLIGSARGQLAATTPDAETFQSYAQTLADAEHQRRAVNESLTALSKWRTDLELSARELIGAARTTLSRARAGKAHTDFVVELTSLQRSAAELLKKLVDS
jgi:hypothetical protein